MRNPAPRRRRAFRPLRAPSAGAEYVQDLLLRGDHLLLVGDQLLLVRFQHRQPLAVLLDRLAEIAKLDGLPGENGAHNSEERQCDPDRRSLFRVRRPRNDLLNGGCLPLIESRIPQISRNRHDANYTAIGVRRKGQRPADQAGDRRLARAPLSILSLLTPKHHSDCLGQSAHRANDFNNSKPWLTGFLPKDLTDEVLSR